MHNSKRATPASTYLVVGEGEGKGEGGGGEGWGGGKGEGKVDEKLDISTIV